ncbi:MAG: TraM recognition domain-containing protein [Candidatus Micrarchaeia archaeon]
MIESSVKEKKTILGIGYSMDNPSKKITIAIPDDDRKGHFWCFGTTRVGKTRLIEGMVEQDIRKGYSVVIIDPKGDIELFSKVVQVAFEENRFEELILVTAIFPEYSALIDPLAFYYMPEELVGHIVSGVDVKEPFFYNVAYEISMIIVQSLLLKAKVEGKPHSFNLNEVKDRMSREEIEKLLQEVQSIDLPEARQLEQDMLKIVNSPQDYYSKVSSSLRVALMELSSGNIGKIIGKADENRFIKRLESGQRVIMVVHLGSLLTRKAAFTLGKVVISMIQSYVGRVFSSGKKVNPPLALYIDEAQNTLYYDIEDLFAKAGGAGVWIHGFSQSVNQIYSRVGKDFGRSILDNTNTKVFMRVPDPETAEYVSSHFGTKKFISPVLSPNAGITTKESEEPVVKIYDVLNLPPRQFYLMTYKGRFKGRTLDVSDAYIEVKFPEAVADVA